MALFKLVKQSQTFHFTFWQWKVFEMMEQMACPFFQMNSFLLTTIVPWRVAFRAHSLRYLSMSIFESIGHKNLVYVSNLSYLIYKWITWNTFFYDQLIRKGVIHDSIKMWFQKEFGSYVNRYSILTWSTFNWESWWDIKYFTP